MSNWVNLILKVHASGETYTQAVTLLYICYIYIYIYVDLHYVIVFKISYIAS